MKTAGLLLLFSGWLLVLSALAMLNRGFARSAFVAAGVLVEVLGLALTGRAHVHIRSGRG